jgi:hypothetical protein
MANGIKTRIEIRLNRYQTSDTPLQGVAEEFLAINFVQKTTINLLLMFKVVGEIKVFCMYCIGL